MIRFATALAFSVALHAAVLCGVHAVCRVRSGEGALPELDLSSVEMSFSETPSETAPVRSVPSLATAGGRPLARPPESPTVEPVRNAEGTAVAPVFETVVRAPKTPEADLPDRPVPEELAERESAPAVPSVTGPVESAPAPVQARVDAPPEPRRTIRPKYPEGARRRGAEGDVTLDLSVAVNGNVGTVTVVSSSGDSELDAAAVKAVRHARFRPARKDGRNAPSHASITLSFRLRDR